MSADEQARGACCGALRSLHPPQEVAESPLAAVGGDGSSPRPASRRAEKRGSGVSGTDLRSWYLQYVAALDGRRLDEMDRFIADEVVLNGDPGTRR